MQMNLFNCSKGLKKDASGLTSHTQISNKSETPLLLFIHRFRNIPVFTTASAVDRHKKARAK